MGVWHLIQGHSILLYSLGVFLLLIINISHINSQPTWKEGHGFIKHIGWQCTKHTENNLTLFIICIIEKNVRSRSLDIGQVLFCIFKDQNEVNVDKNTKKEQSQIVSNRLDWTSLRSIKDLLKINYKAKRRTCKIDIVMGNPERARKAYLACSGSQAEHRLE